MLTATTPYYRLLDDGLVMKTIDGLADVERLCAFDQQIFGSNVGDFSRSLILHHPATRPEHWLFIEDETIGQIVSMLVLIPWMWRYEDITLRTAEMGIVGTLDTYRHRGLVRALVTRYKELLHEGDYDLSHIQGIPYFYRQFGYEYAVPLEAKWHLELHNVPDESVPRYSFRMANLDDIPALMRLYDEAAQALNISVIRDEAVWRYLFEHTAGTDTESETGVVLDAASEPVAYWRVAHHGFGEGLNISETSRLNHAAAVALLGYLKKVAVERNKPYIRLNLPATNNLVRTAHAFGLHDAGSYAWQIHLVDVARLLCKLSPVLERRIATSGFAGLSQRVILNLYREAFELHFERGKLLEVSAIGFSDKGEIRIPPLLFAPLLLGYRDREELSRNYPDFGVWGSAQQLLDVLFPKLDSFLFTIY